jgi:hypothetical protein
VPCPVGHNRLRGWTQALEVDSVTRPVPAGCRQTYGSGQVATRSRFYAVLRIKLLKTWNDRKVPTHGTDSKSRGTRLHTATRACVQKHASSQYPSHHLQAGKQCSSQGQGRDRRQACLSSCLAYVKCAQKRVGRKLAEMLQRLALQKTAGNWISAFI